MGTLKSMKPKVYIEITIPSYLAARPTRDLIVAVAAVHAMDFLMTWNCAHLANAMIAGQIRRVCDAAGYTCPVICTPEELFEG